MSTGPLLPGARQGWMDRPGPPSVLREMLPCRRRPDLFAPIPIRPRSPAAVSERHTTARRRETAELLYRHRRAQRICNGAPGYDQPCPLRMQCLAWALAAKERVVAGGIIITAAMIEGYKRDPEGALRAAEEAGTPEDWARQLAKRSRAAQRQQNQGAGDGGRGEGA